MNKKYKKKNIPQSLQTQMVTLRTLLYVFPCLSKDNSWTKCYWNCSFYNNFRRRWNSHL